MSQPIIFLVEGDAQQKTDVGRISLEFMACVN